MGITLPFIDKDLIQRLEGYRESWNPPTLILFLALLSRLCQCLLMTISDLLIPDHSPDPSVLRFAGSPAWATRFDSAHFLHNAQNGYPNTQQTAFFPLWPFLINVVGGSPLAGLILANIFFILAAREMYLLTLGVFGNKDTAFKAAIVFIINPASVFFSIPYTEALFAFLVFSGLRRIESDRLAQAALFLTAATTVRANGIINIFFYPAYFIRTSLHNRKKPNLWKLMIVSAYMSMIVLPFVFFQIWIYKRFCPEEPWCQNTIPIAYTYIQKKYWNNGFLQYWQFKKIPNFLLGSPVYIIAGNLLIQYCKRLCTNINGFKVFLLRIRSFLMEPQIAYNVHFIVSGIQILFFNNAEIVTRYVAASSPAFIWILSQQDDKIWGFYCILYVILGTIMHANFLPWT